MRVGLEISISFINSLILVFVNEYCDGWVNYNIAGVLNNI